MNVSTITTCLLIALSAALSNAAPVQITAGANNTRTVKAPGYDAIVAADGCLTNLRLGGAEFLKPGVSISRGTYFHQGGALNLPNITQPADNTIAASSDKAEVRYEFAPAAMVWTVVNKTDQAMQFFLIFDPSVVTAVMNDKGETARPAVANNWQKTIWFAGKNRLEVTGSTKLWGPWAGPYQVWDATLKPKETRKIEFKIDQASDAELALIAKSGSAQPATPAKQPAGGNKQPPAAPPATAPAVANEKQPTGPVSGTVTEVALQDFVLKVAKDGDAKQVLVYNMTVLTEIFVAGKSAKFDDIKKGMKITVVTSNGKDAERIDAGGAPPPTTPPPPTKPKK